jgi:hypothetical protein
MELCTCWRQHTTAVASMCTYEVFSGAAHIAESVEHVTSHTLHMYRHGAALECAALRAAQLQQHSDARHHDIQ